MESMSRCRSFGEEVGKQRTKVKDTLFEDSQIEEIGAKHLIRHPDDLILVHVEHFHLVETVGRLPERSPRDTERLVDGAHPFLARVRSTALKKDTMAATRNRSSL